MPSAQIEAASHPCVPMWPLLLHDATAESVRIAPLRGLPGRSDRGPLSGGAPIFSEETPTMYRLLSTTLAVALTIALSPSAHAKKKDGKGQKQAPAAAVQHGGNGGGHSQGGQYAHGNPGHKAPKGGAYHAPKAPVVYKAPKAGKHNPGQTY